MRIAWVKPPPVDGAPAPRSRLYPVAYIVLLMLSAVSVLAVVVGVPNYLRSVDVVRGFSIEFPSLQIVDDGDDLQAVGRLRLHNDSPLPLRIEGCYFDLHLGQPKVGISVHAFWGTDPASDNTPHDRTLDIRQVIAPYESLDLEFTMHLLPTNFDFVRNQLRSGNTFWFTRATFNIIPPFADETIPVGAAAALMEQ